MDEFYVAIVFALYMTLVYFYYMVCVVTEICHYLDISLLLLKNKTAKKHE